jgi:hypothetical protein
MTLASDEVAELLPPHEANETALTQAVASTDANRILVTSTSKCRRLLEFN